MLHTCRPTLVSTIQPVSVLSYLFIQGLHDRDEVLQARLAVLRHISETGSDRLDPRHRVEEGVLHARCGLGCIPFMEVLITIDVMIDTYLEFLAFSLLTLLAVLVFTCVVVSKIASDFFFFFFCRVSEISHTKNMSRKSWKDIDVSRLYLHI